MKSLIFAVIMLFFCISANAGCSKKDFTGVWATYFTGSDSSATACNISVPANKTIGIAKCIAITQPDIGTQNFSYEIEKTSGCVFMAKLTDANGGVYGINGSISPKNKDVITGLVVWDTIDEKKWSGAFSGTKAY